MLLKRYCGEGKVSRSNASKFLITLKGSPSSFCLPFSVAHQRGKCERVDAFEKLLMSDDRKEEHGRLVETDERRENYGFNERENSKKI